MRVFKLKKRTMILNFPRWSRWIVTLEKKLSHFSFLFLHFRLVVSLSFVFHSIINYTERNKFDNFLLLMSDFNFSVSYFQEDILKLDEIPRSKWFFLLFRLYKWTKNFCGSFIVMYNTAKFSYGNGILFGHRLIEFFGIILSYWPPIIH